MATATLNRWKGRTEPTRDWSSESWHFAGHYDPTFTTAVLAELDRLAHLPPNWDQYGAPKIDPSILAVARTFIEALPENLAYRPRVVPMSPGNLQFEWHYQGKILELEFETAKTIHFLQWHKAAGVEEESTFPASDIDTAVDLIQWFMSGTTV